MESITVQKAAVRRGSLHDRRRAMCFPEPIRPMMTVMYNLSTFARNLSGENSSSSAMLRSSPPGGGSSIALTWYVC